MSLSINTPLLESLPLSQLNGVRVWMKMEAMQPAGSFKIRGIGHACQHHFARGARRFISSSGGNAGLAVAYAGRKMGVPVVVVVPESTSARARHLLLLEGAEVKVHGETWAEANDLALSLLNSDDAFIHPFDDPLLWEGHSTMIDEVIAEGIRPDAIVLSVGGGGLLAGVELGLQHNNLDIPIFAVETEGMASFNAALKAGRPVPVPKLTGVATSLGARQVCQQAFDDAIKYKIFSLMVTDQQAVHACLNFLDDHRALVEPACGAALAALYEKKVDTSGMNNILVIVCGGSTTTIAALQNN